MAEEALDPADEAQIRSGCVTTDQNESVAWWLLKRLTNDLTHSTTLLQNTFRSDACC